MKLYKIMFICFILFMIVCSTKPALAADGEPTSLTLTKQFFDGRNLVYWYLDEREAVVTIRFTIPDNLVDKVANADDPVIEAKNQLMTAYTIFKLDDRIAQLEAKTAIPYSAKPKIDPNLKPKFSQEITAATEYANENSLKYDPNSGLYDQGRDFLFPFPTPGETQGATPPVGGVDDASFDFSVFTWVVLIIIVACICVAIWFVYRKGV